MGQDWQGLLANLLASSDIAERVAQVRILIVYAVRANGSAGGALPVFPGLEPFVVVDLVGQGSYRFLENGQTMLATDASGNRLAHYRRPWTKASGRNMIDVVVSDHGKSIPGFDIVVAATTPLIVRFGDEPMAKYM